MLDGSVSRPPRNTVEARLLATSRSMSLPSIWPWAIPLSMSSCGERRPLLELVVDRCARIAFHASASLVVVMKKGLGQLAEVLKTILWKAEQPSEDQRSDTAGRNRWRRHNAPDP